MGRAPCCSKEGLKKGPWSTKEDLLLTNYIQQHGEGQWRSLPKKAGLLRCGKSCRLRWMNYLRPGIKRGNFSPEEEDLIVRLHSLLGNRWSLIAGRLPGRTDNEIKNYWNTHLLKKLKSSGVEPRPPRKIVAKDSKKKATKIPPKKPGDGNTKKKKKESHDNQGYKVYAPKAIRLSSVSRNNSVEDIAGSVSSSSGEVENKATADGSSSSFIPWNLYELRDDDFCAEVFTAAAAGDDFSPQCALPGGDDCLLDKVYDEYLQLLSENCFLEDDPFGANL